MTSTTSLLDDEEKKRQLFWSVVWLLFAACVVLPLTMFLAPFWLAFQLLEAFLPVTCEVNAFLERLLTWPRLIGVAIRDSSSTFPMPAFDTAQGDNLSNEVSGQNHRL